MIWNLAKDSRGQTDTQLCGYVTGSREVGFTVAVG